MKKKDIEILFQDYKNLEIVKWFSGYVCAFRPGTPKRREIVAVQVKVSGSEIFTLKTRLTKSNMVAQLRQRRVLENHSVSLAAPHPE